MVCTKVKTSLLRTELLSIFLHPALKSAACVWGFLTFQCPFPRHDPGLAPKSFRLPTNEETDPWTAAKSHMCTSCAGIFFFFTFLQVRYVSATGHWAGH